MVENERFDYLKPFEDNPTFADSMSARELPSARRTIDGIAFGRKDFSGADFVFSVRKLKDKFVVRASIPDLSEIVQKDDENDRLFRSIVRSFPGQHMVPEAIFKEDKLNSALTTSFALIKNKDNILEIQSVKVERTHLNYKKSYTSRNANHVVRNFPNNPDIPPLVKLEPELIERRRALGSEPKRYSPNDVVSWGFIDKELRILTGEALTKFCMENEIPVLYKVDRRRYDTQPVIHEGLGVPYTDAVHPLIQYAALVNTRNIIAFTMGEPFVHPLSELEELKYELSNKRREDSDRTIQSEKNKSKIAGLTKEELKLMVPDVFHEAVVASIDEDMLSTRTTIQRELIARLSEGSTEISDIRLLLNLQNKEGNLDELHERAIYSLYKYPKYRNGLVRELQKIKGSKLSRLAYQTVENEIDSKTVYDTQAGGTVNGKGYHSSVFRGESLGESKGLALTNMLSIILEIENDVDRTLQEKAGLGKDTKGFMLEGKEVIAFIEQSKPLNKLIALCKKNGWKVESATSIEPGDQTPYSTRLTVTIGNFSILTEKKSYSSAEGEKYTARKLFNQLNGPRVDNLLTTGQNFETEVESLVESYGFATPPTIIERSGNPLSPKINCIRSLEDERGTYYFIGTADSEEEARNIASAKTYFVLKKNIAEDKE